MLYKPNFCCQCGARIERIEWKLWSSRKFCEVCEKGFRKAEWLPRIFVCGGILFGIYGFGSYLKTPQKPLNIVPNQVLLNSSNRTSGPKTETIPASNNPKKQEQDNKGPEQNPGLAENPDSPNNAGNQISSKPPGALPKSNEAKNPQISAVEPVYYCGARTKKGTLCTRRVKGGGRCWQHIGQPAMMPPEKLIVSQ